VRFVYAEGLNLGDEAQRQGIASALQQIEEAVAA
jgi:FMN-dependent NADH-azoreductase